MGFQANFAGPPQPANTILLNARGVALTTPSPTANACYIAPLRADTGSSACGAALYDPTTFEVTYLTQPTCAGWAGTATVDSAVWLDVGPGFTVACPRVGSGPVTLTVATLDGSPASYAVNLSVSAVVTGGGPVLGPMPTLTLPVGATTVTTTLWTLFGSAGAYTVQARTQLALATLGASQPATLSVVVTGT